MKRKPQRDDVGPDSTSEHQKRLLEIRCSGLEVEVDDLKHERAILQVAVQKQGPSDADG